VLFLRVFSLIITHIQRALFLRKMFEFSLHKTKTSLLRRNPQNRRRKHAAEYVKQ